MVAESEDVPTAYTFGFISKTKIYHVTYEAFIVYNKLFEL
jgi:hypothetical protein